MTIMWATTFDLCREKSKAHFNFVRRVADNKDWVNIYLCVNEVFCPHSNADKRSCYVFSYKHVHSVLRHKLFQDRSRVRERPRQLNKIGLGT